MTDQDLARAGVASRRLPGTLHELVATGDLPPGTPGLAELEAEMTSGWFTIVQVGERLDQRGWSLTRDAELAWRACARLASLDVAGAGHLGVVRRWLDGVAGDGELERSFTVSVATRVAIESAGATDEQALRVFDVLCPNGGALGRETLLDARRRPPQPSHAWRAVESATSARQGWLSYHVHRGLLPPAPLHAAAAIRQAAQARVLSFAEVVDWARELARAPHQPHPRASEPGPHAHVTEVEEDLDRCEGEDEEPRVLVLSDGGGGGFARALEVWLDQDGCAPRGQRTDRFPIADGLAGLLSMLTERYEVLVVAIGHYDDRTRWVVRECSMRSLYPNVIVALAPGLPLPEGAAPAHDWIVPSGEVGSGPRQFEALRGKVRGMLTMKGLIAARLRRGRRTGGRGA